MESLNHPGLITDDYLHQEDELYIDSSSLEERYGITATDAQIRLAMVILHDHCNRRTLWPSEYMQRISMPADRVTSRLAVRPVLSIVEAKGRYTFGRRDRQLKQNNPAGYIAITALIGTSSSWVDIDTATIDFYGPTGEIWVPTGLFLSPYGELQISYMAGYVNIPEKAVAALALIVNSVCSKGSGDMIAYTAGKVSRRFQTASFIDKDIKRMLAPFVVHSLE